MSGRAHSSYLVRLSEAGKEAQPGRRKQRHDVAAAIARRVAGAKMEMEVGRIFLEADADARKVLEEVHGITSFSPCVRCEVAALEETALAIARPALETAATFRVKVKRVGQHSFDSIEMAASIGARIGAELPNVRVSMSDADVTIGIEIRDRECFVFDEVVAGLDRRGPGAEPGAGVPRFVVDQMLGTLVPWLRLLGFDSEYVCDEPDTVLLRMAREQGRVILTRDLELSRSRSAPTLFVHATEPEEQLIEVVEGLGLRISRRRLFTRCALCNREVEVVDKSELRDRIPRVAYELYDEFTACAACDKVYWRGAQYQRILARLERVLED